MILLKFPKTDITYHYSLTHSCPAGSLSHSHKGNYQWCYCTFVDSLHCCWCTHPHLEKGSKVFKHVMSCTMHIDRSHAKFSRIEKTMTYHSCIKPKLMFCVNTSILAYLCTWCSHLESGHTGGDLMSSEKMSDTSVGRHHSDCSPIDPRKSGHCQALH